MSQHHHWLSVQVSLTEALICAARFLDPIRIQWQLQKEPPSFAFITHWSTAVELSFVMAAHRSNGAEDGPDRQSERWFYRTQSGADLPVPLYWMQCTFQCERMGRKLLWKKSMYTVFYFNKSNYDDSTSTLPLRLWWLVADIFMAWDGGRLRIHQRHCRP